MINLGSVLDAFIDKLSVMNRFPVQQVFLPAAILEFKRTIT